MSDVPSHRDLLMLQERIGQLIENCTGLLEAGLPTALGGGPQGGTPSTIMGHFSTIIAKTQGLVRLVQEEKWQDLVVLPHILHLEDPEFYPRILLRSKGIPEVEQKETQLLLAADDSDAKAIEASTTAVTAGTVAVA
ncbi:hypothetical protein HDU91_006060 [Kappamyces sp. JEL0680]|nr:hypothetical protein HDU91_006060 [Kappamyces sp. JEL0680]